MLVPLVIYCVIAEDRNYLFKTVMDAVIIYISAILWCVHNNMSIIGLLHEHECNMI